MGNNPREVLGGASRKDGTWRVEMRLGQEGHRPALLGPDERQGLGKGPILKNLESQIKIWVSTLRWYDLEKVSNQEHHVVKLVSMKSRWLEGQRDEWKLEHYAEVGGMFQVRGEVAWAGQWPGDEKKYLEQVGAWKIWW